MDNLSITEIDAAINELARGLWSSNAEAYLKALATRPEQLNVLARTIFVRNAEALAISANDTMVIESIDVIRRAMIILDERGHLGD